MVFNFKPFISYYTVNKKIRKKEIKYKNHIIPIDILGKEDYYISYKTYKFRYE